MNQRDGSPLLHELARQASQTQARTGMTVGQQRGTSFAISPPQHLRLFDAILARPP
jgi:hypothetical protein